MSDPERAEPTYPLRAAARITGLSPELLRAWESRYGVVVPLRTPGGTRRYRASDLERLRLVKAAVDAGHRIGRVASLDRGALEALAAGAAGSGGASGDPAQERVLQALTQLDAEESRRLLSFQLSTLGPIRFAREFALPLVHEIGDRWASARMSVASEHLASGVLRSMLGSALSPTTAARLGPTLVFATPTGERHELGLQVAALTAMGAGANPVYLGAELPVDEMLGAVERCEAAVLALSLVTLSRPAAARALGAIREGLPDDVRLWIGGAAAVRVAAIEGVEVIAELGELERRVALLAYETPRR